MEMSDAVSTNPVMERLTTFTEYFVSEFEKVLIWTCDFLDGKITTETPSNIATDIFCVTKEGLSFLGSPAAAPAKSVADMLSKKFFHYIEHQKNKRSVSGLLKLIKDYKRQENQPHIRKILVDAATELFYCYEMPFMCVTNEFAGETRALLKLAADAVRIILHYYTQEQIEESLTVKLITSSFLHDAKYSLINNFVSNIEKPKHTIRITMKGIETKIKTFKLFYKTGLVDTDGETTKYYKTNYSNTDKYGYKRRFSGVFHEPEPLVDCELENNEFDDYEFFLTPDKILETSNKLLEHINKNDKKLAELRTKLVIEENTNKTIDEVKAKGDELKELVDRKTDKIIEKIETMTIVSDKMQEIEQKVGDLKEVIRAHTDEKDDEKLKDKLAKELITSVEKEGERFAKRVEKSVSVVKNQVKTNSDAVTNLIEVKLPKIDPSHVIKRETDRVGKQVKNEVRRFLKRF